jgi:hypothetical protein
MSPGPGGPRTSAAVLGTTLRCAACGGGLCHQGWGVKSSRSPAPRAAACRRLQLAIEDWEPSVPVIDAADRDDQNGDHEPAALQKVGHRKSVASTDEPKDGAEAGTSEA